MAQQIINNGESGLVVRNKLNLMFAELYGALVLPLKLPGINTNTQQVISADSFVQSIYISSTIGNPSIRIGITPNGEEILPEIQPGSFTQVTVEQYFSGDTNFYISISGGTVNIRFGLISKFY
jgi:hypothetical protein